MNEKTAQALRAIDRAFYEDCADAFSATRSRPWSGFAEILERTREPLSVLDLGCGNGRFAQALADHVRVEHYVGLDQSAALLARAKTLVLPFPTAFHEVDLLMPGAPWPAGPFSLVVLFGVLHHIPGLAKRCELLSRAGAVLAPGGLLAASFYRYDRSPRMMRRRIAPQQHLAAHNLEQDDFEPGDFLIPFGATGHLRYCHLFNDAEIRALGRIEGLTLADHFSRPEGSDRLNDYVLWQHCK